MSADDLARRLGELCRLTGEFTLRSGAVATTYFDKFLFQADPALLREIVLQLAPLVPPGTDVLAGQELGGVPVATALSFATGLPACFMRKQAKTYGTEKFAEGADVADKRVLIVEDVITTGGQVVESVAQLRALGAIVDTVVCVIDRSEGNHERLAAADLKLVAFVRLRGRRVTVLDRVADAMREVSVTAIEPRFRALAEGDVEEKSPGELVTVADRDAEAALVERLTDIIGGVPVVGEENCATDPALLTLVHAERAWLVDPLDGTANFVAGSPEWAVMVALLERGDPVASWMWQPMTGRMYVAERGAGAACNDATLRIEACPSRREELRGPVFSRFMMPDMAAAVERSAVARFARLPGRYCAGFEYPALIEGEQDFAVFWRTLPWDHVPGTLLLAEAGGVARRPNGAGFLPYSDGEGLVLARDEAAWEEAIALLA